MLVDGVENENSFIEVPKSGLDKKVVTIDYQIEKTN